MSIKLRENEHHREMELSKMADEVTRLELAQQKAGKSVNAVKVSSGAKEPETLGSETTTDIRSIIREEIQSALTHDRQDGGSLHNETWTKSVNYVGTASRSNRNRGHGYRPRGRGRSSRDSRDNLKNAEPMQNVVNIVIYLDILEGNASLKTVVSDVGNQDIKQKNVWLLSQSL